MNLPTYFPTWMTLYFGISGTIALVLIALIFWTWRQTTRLAQGYERTALVWSTAGYIFLFSANWFACGIGSAPGNLLSTDPAMRQPLFATFAAIMAMGFSLPGWACIWMSQRTILKGLQSGVNRVPSVGIKTAPVSGGD